MRRRTWRPHFTFGGHACLAINQDGAFNAFDDAGGLLLDITGAAGTIAASNFVRRRMNSN
jgi:hypothetical protein